MAVSLSTIAAKDSAGTAIAGGLQAQDKSGAGSGPFTLGQVIIDGAAGVNMATVKSASTAPVATDPALVVSISPNSVNVNGQATMANSAPVVIASNQTGIPQGVTATANGATASRINAAASNNLTSVKASAGQLYTIDVFNAAAYNVFLKIYNKASAPVVASDTPVMTIPIQAGGGYSKTWPMGFPLGTGIAYAIVKLQADTDATNVVAGDLTGNIIWI